jgi:hypothetical protein
MIVIDAPCWKCEKEMKIALLANESGDLDGGPEVFSKEQISLAEKNGVFIKVADSMTADESYLANTCRECDAFVGKWFFFAHYLTPALYGDYKYKIL